jgi:5-deoxy-5-amino-3-dehydroquinate synthase
MLVGMGGVGKTTVGPLLARRLGRAFVDTDEEVERVTGRTIADLVATSGEPAFREEESRALASLLSLSAPSVVCVAGGAVLAPANRELLRRAGTVVWLRARPDTILRNVGRAEGRFTLLPDPATAVPRLVAERYPAYEAVATCAVDVDEGSPEEVATLVASALVRVVHVAVPGHPYDVFVGPGARLRLAEVLPSRARRAAIVSQAGIGIEVEPGIDSVRLTIADGEAAKSLRTVEELCRGFSRAGVTRHDVVVAVGGGVVTDVAGFAASCYHRGLDVVHVSTSLLGQVDAAIGGKTGVNLPEGKNLVGAFWQPHAVICDTDALASLPEREWRSGLGEMAKYAFLGVDDLDRLPLAEQVARCVALKASVVAEDEREGGSRMLLNYGHTLAHALEAAGFARDTGEARDAGEEERGTGKGGAGEHAAGAAGQQAGFQPLRHGEAVGVGLVFAARLARLLGRIDDERVLRHVEVVGGYGLATTIPPGASVDELVMLMGRDKKATDGLTFVLDGPVGAEVVSGVEREAVEAALVESGAAPGPATGAGR